MNNTHYALINEDNDVVAVIKNKLFKYRLIEAIQDETDNEILSIHVEEIDYNNYKVNAELKDGFKYVATLRPTWEY